MGAAAQITDKSSCITSSEQATTTMNSNANTNGMEGSEGMESSSKTNSSSEAGATAAASNGRTTFDNSKGVEIQAGAIQAAQASSATQTDLIPGDKGTDSATNSTSSEQPVPDAANGGPLPEPTGPPNNGIGNDTAKASFQPSNPAAENGQPQPTSPEPADGQPSPPEEDVVPPQGSDAANSADTQAPPDSSAPTPPEDIAIPEDEGDEEGLSARSDHGERDVEHYFRERDRVLHKRLIRRNRTLL